MTYAPLYCATSSPNTNTFSFADNSSTSASFSASRTVISFCALHFCPEENVLDTTAGFDNRWKLDRGIAADGELRRSCAAGRTSRAETIVLFLAATAG